MRYFKRNSEEIYITPYFIEYHHNKKFQKASSLKTGLHKIIIKNLIDSGYKEFYKE